MDVAARGWLANKLKEETEEKERARAQLWRDNLLASQYERTLVLHSCRKIGVPSRLSRLIRRIKDFRVTIRIPSKQRS
jgi:hypothetical protein